MPKLSVNPATGKLDNVARTSSEVDFNGTGTAPTGKPDGWFEADEYSGDGIVYFFANGNRYKIAATLDNPPAGDLTGQPMGLLLSLTYPS